MQENAAYANDSARHAGGGACATALLGVGGVDRQHG